MIGEQGLCVAKEIRTEGSRSVGACCGSRCVSVGVAPRRSLHRIMFIQTMMGLWAGSMGLSAAAWSPDQRGAPLAKTGVLMNLSTRSSRLAFTCIAMNDYASGLNPLLGSAQ